MSIFDRPANYGKAIVETKAEKIEITAQQAISFIKLHAPVFDGKFEGSEYKKALIMAISALNKQIVKKPVYGSVLCCPVCGNWISEIRRYCENCGQKLRDTEADK